MGYIRAVWTFLGMVFMLILNLPAMLLALLIGLFNMDVRDKMTMFLVKAAFKVMLFNAGTKIHVTGLENIPKDKAVLYVGNHRSFFDVMVCFTYFPRITGFIAKKSFEKTPYISWWMRMLHSLFLDRDDIKQGLKVILEAIDHVKNGISICVFPEGTRNRSYEKDMLDFHEGSFKIATKTDCPIIPMTMYNMSACFEDHFPKVYAKHVFIDFGKPFIPSELEAEEIKHIGAYTRDIMLNKYEELKKQYEELNVK